MLSTMAASLEVRGWRARRLRGSIVVLAIAPLVCATAAFAEDNAEAKAGLDVWRNSGCAECHGAFANGDKQRDESPTGADLRTAKLDTEALKLVISCGRPGGAGMPAFLEGAYKVQACYGRPLGEEPDNLYPSGVKISPGQIDAVIAYLQARIMGHGRITKDECLLYYEGNEDECQDYN